MAADIIQVCQDGQVVFKGGVAEPQGRENRKSRVERGRGRLAATNNETLRLTNNEQSRYAISNRIATTASTLQRSAENLRRAGHVPARRDIIFFTFQTAPVSGFNDR